MCRTSSPIGPLNKGWYARFVSTWGYPSGCSTYREEPCAFHPLMFGLRWGEFGACISPCRMKTSSISRPRPLARDVALRSKFHEDHPITTRILVILRRWATVPCGNDGFRALCPNRAPKRDPREALAAFPYKPSLKPGENRPTPAQPSESKWNRHRSCFHEYLLRWRFQCRRSP